MQWKERRVSRLPEGPVSYTVTQYPPRGLRVVSNPPRGLRVSDPQLCIKLGFFFADPRVGEEAAREAKALAESGRKGKVLAGGCEHLSVREDGEVVAHSHRLSPGYKARAEEVGIRII